MQTNRYYKESVVRLRSIWLLLFQFVAFGKLRTQHFSPFSGVLVFVEIFICLSFVCTISGTFNWRAAPAPPAPAECERRRCQKGGGLRATAHNVTNSYRYGDILHARHSHRIVVGLEFCRVHIIYPAFIHNLIRNPCLSSRQLVNTHSVQANDQTKNEIKNASHYSVYGSIRAAVVRLDRACVSVCTTGKG